MTRSSHRRVYGRRTSCVRALWVVVTPPALQTRYMTAARVTTFVTAAAGLLGGALLLALPLVVPQARETEAVRTIDVTLSRFAFSPERIEVRLGERVWLNVVSIDGTHGFQVKELGLNARAPGRGMAVAVELTPTEAGTFRITCSEYCGTGHSRMKGLLVVTPGNPRAD
jgi:cytochrome c oxidase subunit 2